MSKVYNISMSESGEDKVLLQTTLDPTKFGTGVKTNAVKNGGEETVYKYVSGSDPAIQESARVGWYPPADRSKPASVTNTSVKIKSVGTETDSVSGEISYFPLEVTVAFSDGSHGRAPRADVAAMLQMAQSIIIQGVAPDGDPSMSALTRLAYGETDVLNTVFVLGS